MAAVHAPSVFSLTWNIADRWSGACGSGTSSLCVFFGMEHLLTGGLGLVAAVHPPSVFSLTWNIADRCKRGTLLTGGVELVAAVHPPSVFSYTAPGDWS